MLVTAPTGSGKTLAAFLWALDRLVGEAIAAGGPLPDRTSVLYVSPLKALSNDVRRNLEEPLGEIKALAAELGYPAPEVRTAVRTGDTTARERRAATRRPPHVLVTTPESLFILLTSESGRRALRDVRTVIVDEIHAVAPDKRGAHLALSLERLEALVASQPVGTLEGFPHPPAKGSAEQSSALPTRPRLQRVGLSATVRPLEVASRLLVGGTRPPPALVDVGQRRDLDLGVEVPEDELGAVATNEQWVELYDRIAALARAHKSTLVFVNTRRLVERVTLAPLRTAGRRRRRRAPRQPVARAAPPRRAAAQSRASSRWSSPRRRSSWGSTSAPSSSAASSGRRARSRPGLQRIGRSGHALHATPKGRLFPLTRDQLVECAALVRAARRAEIDAVCLRDAPLDVLSQQIVAASSCDEWDEDALYDALPPRRPLRRARARRLRRRGRHAGRGDRHQPRARGRAPAPRRRQPAAARPARRAPGRAHLRAAPSRTTPTTTSSSSPTERRSGPSTRTSPSSRWPATSSCLGNSSWRIRRVEPGKVRVEDAAGAPPTIPFWLGEGPARTRELSAEVAALRAQIVDAHARHDDVAPALESECALDRRGAELLRDYVLAGAAVLGGVPTQTRIFAERFFDDAGGMQLVIHAPFGGRINRAWGMALRKRFCRSFDFELQAAATDDGIVLSLGPQHSFPLETVFSMLRGG